MISTWLANKTSGVRVRLMQVLSAGPADAEPCREWIEPAETRTALGLPEDAIVVGHHVPLTDARMYRFLLDVISEAHHLDARVRLLLVADGVWRAAMEDQAAAMGLRKFVIFANTMFDSTRLLQAIDVLAFPSAVKGLGRAIAEAADAGVPCVVSTDGSLGSPREWAATLLDRASQPGAAKPEPWREASLERLSAIYRTT